MLHTLDRHGLDPDRPATQRLARIVAILTSSPVYLDQIGSPRDQVLDGIAWAVRTLTRSVREQTDDTSTPSTGRVPDRFGRADVDPVGVDRATCRRGRGTTSLRPRRRPA